MPKMWNALRKTILILLVGLLVVPASLLIQPIEYAAAADCPTDTTVSGAIDTASAKSQAVLNNANGNNNIDAYKQNLVSLQANIITVEGHLTTYAQNRCGSESSYKNFVGRLNERIRVYNGFLGYYNQIKKSSDVALTNHADFTQTYAANVSEAKCNEILTRADGQVVGAEGAMTSAAQGIDKWLRDDAENGAAGQAMEQAANALKTAQTTLTEAKNNGCDIGATQAKYQGLQNRINGLWQKAQELNQKIADSGKSLVNQAWNGLLNAAVQLEGEGNCSKITVQRDGLISIIYKAFCYAIAAVSAALGGFACLLAEQIIDPVFNNGSNTPTCQTKNIGKKGGSSSSGGSSTPAPSTSGSTSSSPSSSPSASPPPPQPTRVG